MLLPRLCLALAVMFAASGSAVAANSSSRSSVLEVYQQALANNADLAAAYADLQATQELTPQARAGLLPQLAGAASSSHNRTKLDTDQGTLTRSRSGYLYQASLSQPLFRLDRWYQLKSAQALSEQATLEYSAIEQNLILQSAEAYFAVLRAQDNLAASKAEETAFKRQFDLANERFTVGLSDKTDVLQAQAALDAARANRLVAARMVEDAFQLLNTLTNRPYSALQGVQHNLPIVKPTPSDASSWVKTAVEQNLQLQATAHAVAAAEQGLKQRKSAYAPSVDAIAQYQRGDNDALGLVNSINLPSLGGGPSPIPRYNGQASQGSIGIQLTVPLYTGGMLSSQIREGVYRLDQAEQLQESLRRNVVQNTRNYHRAIHTDVDTVQARRQAIVSSYSAVEATQVGYDVGTRSIVDVLDAQRQLYAAVRNYNDARYDYILNNLRLQQVTGSLSPNALIALGQHLNPTYNPANDFLPPNLEAEMQANLRSQ